MLRPLRRQVQEALEKTAARRKPALRRSDDPDALLATDLPLVCEDTEAFVRVMTEAGWHVWEKGGWLLMDIEVSAPNAPLLRNFPGEAGCCISLLQRHANERSDREAVRALVKAEDAGYDQFERLCARWHRQWAEALRLGKPLPGGLLPYLCHAAQRYTEEAAK